jgi:hypothetical protein
LTRGMVEISFLRFVLRLEGGVAGRRPALNPLFTRFLL